MNETVNKLTVHELKMECQFNHFTQTKIAWQAFFSSLLCEFEFYSLSKRIRSGFIIVYCTRVVGIFTD